MTDTEPEDTFEPCPEGDGEEDHNWRWIKSAPDWSRDLWRCSLCRLEELR